MTKQALKPNESKLSNPKQACGDKKIPLHLVPGSFKAYTALGLFEGMLKYGRMNWRPSGVLASTYRSALDRHLDAWFEGQDEDPLTRVPHLASAAACLAIIIDSMEAGVLVDDRQPKITRPSMGGVPAHRGLIENLEYLKELFKNERPIHYSRLGETQDASNPPNETPDRPTTGVK